MGLYISQNNSGLANTLLSCREHIDHWMVIDASDSMQAIVMTTLGNIPGTYVSAKGVSCAEAYNDFQIEGLNNADSVLLLQDGDIIFDLNLVTIDNRCDIAWLNIEYPEYTTREARLVFKASFEWVGGDQAIPDIPSEFYETAATQGSLVKQSKPLQANHLIDQNKRLQESFSSQLQPATHAALALAKAKNLIALGNIDDAYQLFKELALQNDNLDAQWQGLYLKANIELSAFNQQEVAIASFKACLSLDNDRGEPYARLKEIYTELGQNEDATGQKTKLAALSLPEKALFFEHKIYTQKKKPAIKLDAVETFKKSKDLLQAFTSQATDDEPSVPLTIGMATYDDYDGVYFTIMSLVLYHCDVVDQIEILVVDNNPHSAHGKAVESLCKRVPQARYIAAGEYKGTAVRELVFNLARGKFVACMDCHVFLHQDSVARLLHFFEENPDSNDLFHGPLFYDGMATLSTHMTPKWNDGFFGVWGTDPRGKSLDAAPFEIPMQGLGMFACRRDAWPGFNKRFRGFGGEEGYIHEKFRQRGDKVFCLPFLRWTHRFDRPAGTRYRNIWEDRIRNYLLGAEELALDPTPAIEHFSEHLNKERVALVRAELALEKNSVFYAFDSVFHLSRQPNNHENLNKYGLTKTCQRTDLNTDDVEAELAKILILAHKQRLPEIVILSDEGLDNLKLEKYVSQINERLVNNKLLILKSERIDSQASAIPQMLVCRADMYEHLSGTLLSTSLDELVHNETTTQTLKYYSFDTVN